MPDWLNHAAIATPRNGTTTHTVAPSTGTAAAGALFTPTAGRFLLCVVEGSVTSTTPAGWTLPAGAFAVNNTGLYAWWRTAAGGDSFTTTHNGSDYPVVFDFYEFAAGSVFAGSASATGVANGGAGPTLSGLTGTNWIAAAAGQDNNNSGVDSFTWNSGVEAVDTSVPSPAPADGYTYSLSYREGSTLTSASAVATCTDASVTLERLVFAITPAAGPPPVAAEGTFNTHAMKAMSRR